MSGCVFSVNCWFAIRFMDGLTVSVDSNSGILWVQVIGFVPFGRSFVIQTSHCFQIPKFQSILTMICSDQIHSQKITEKTHPNMQ